MNSYPSRPPPTAPLPHRTFLLPDPLQAEAVFTVGDAFCGDHKAALAALESTTTLQFEYLDALLRPGQTSLSSGEGTPSNGDSTRDNGNRWGAASPLAPTQQRPLPSLAAWLDDADRALHVRLLVRFRPYEVYPFLSTSTG